MLLPWKKNRRTTPQPRRDIVEYVPELAALAKPTVRLHPRRENEPGLAESKLGGTVLWPVDEPWPVCDESGPPDWWDRNTVGPPTHWPGPGGPHGPLVPVLQLRAGDFPEMPFPPGSDLFQLLWCPLEHSGPISCAKPFVFWRISTAVGDPLETAPQREHFEPGYIPQPCRLMPERVTEYPSIDNLPAEIVAKIQACDLQDLLTIGMDDVRDLYNWEFSVCPSNKIGGYVAWEQTPEVPICACGHRMEHLLTITDDEFGTGTYERWCPKEDRHVWGLTRARRVQKRVAISNPARLYGLSGSLFLFICRNCEGWPTQSVYQR